MMQTALKISWFVNLIVVAVLLVAIAIGYCFKVAGSQAIADKVILVCNITTMLILSVMGLILSIQRFQVGLLSTNINAYGLYWLIQRCASQTATKGHFSRTSLSCTGLSWEASLSSS